MPKILLQEEIPLQMQDTLTQEFPQYEFIRECEHDYDWHAVEIIYGNKLSEKQFELAPRLRWIHCPGVDTDQLCREKLKEQGDVLISLSGHHDVSQIAEFVMGGILSFSKQFFHWKEAHRDPQEFWDWPLKETMWTLKNRTLLQVGLGKVGSEIVRLANIFGMKTWGVRRSSSFHPHCQKTFSIRNLHSILPAADVVVIALPQKGVKEILIGKQEFELMKPDSIFIIVGSAEMIDENALVAVSKKGKFRGVLLDAYRHPPPAKNSPLWTIPNVLMTPSVSGIPPPTDLPPLRLFQRNLRVYTPGRINEMKNLIIL